MVIHIRNSLSRIYNFIAIQSFSTLDTNEIVSLETQGINA